MTLSLRRARTTAALTVSLALAPFLAAAPAQAHDALASTSPTDGQTITANPGKVSITLTKPPNTGVAGANILTVKAPDGHAVSNGEVTVEGATLSTDADIDHDGKHIVQWRAVSADGHPIEGIFSFTYTPEAAATSAAVAAVSPSAAATAAAPDPSVATNEAAMDPGTQTEPTSPAGWVLGAVVILAAAIAGLVVFLRHRNKADTTA